MTTGQPSIHLMISYSRNDSAFVDRLEADLKAQGYSTWVDRRKLEPGQRWDAEIRQAITQCDILLVVLSPDALASRFVRQEYLEALKRRKQVIPVRYYPTPELPRELRRLQLANFQAGVNFEATYVTGLADLLKAIAAQVQGIAKAREAGGRSATAATPGAESPPRTQRRWFWWPLRQRVRAEMVLDLVTYGTALQASHSASMPGED